MSTNHSVGRLTATQENDGCAATHKLDRFAIKPKKDRSSLCAFTFADGRQCRTPRCSGHLHLCYFHAQKEAESLAAKQAGKDISTFFFANLLTACDLSAAMARLFTAVAQGQIKPKVASTLAYLSQTMLQSIPIAQHEYCEAFGTEPWRRAVRSSFTPSAPAPNPAPKPPASAAPSPTPVEAGLQPGSSASSTSPVTPQPPVNCHSERSEEPAAASPSSNSSLATHHSPPPQAPQPAPSPHTPLPPTSTEFVQQVLAGRNSSPSEIPTLPGPGRETGSSGSSASSAPSSASSSSDSAPARASSTQPAPSSARTLPTPDNSQPAPTPPAPPPAPPGFGAPANWDALILPKPRRRFSRHWQLLE